MTRHDWAYASIQLHGFKSPLHMFSAMCRPDSLSALLMLAYDPFTSEAPPHQSIFTQSTPHSAKTWASCVQWPCDPTRPPTHTVLPALVYSPNVSPLECT